MIIELSQMSKTDTAEAAKPSHKILVGYIPEKELVSGNGGNFTVSFTNLGEAKFEGRIDSIRFEFREADVTSSLPRDRMPSLPPISPNETVKVALSIYMPCSGNGWILTKVVANDGQPVDHFQNVNYSTGEEGRNNIYVMRFEDKQIIELMNKIVILLGKRV